MAYKDITGMRFGYVIVIREADPIMRDSGVMERRWLCKCDCGNYVTINRSTLKPGTKSSCGCKIKPIDINSGDRFGKLVVIKQCENVRDSSGHMRRAFICRCDCGRIVRVKGHDFNRGRIKCGHCSKNTPKNKKQRKYIKNKRLHNIWYNMKKRCEDPNNHAFKYYGARGITVCNEWEGENGYTNFEKWATDNGYASDLTIDRINPNSEYSPNNCRWADSKTQMRNRTNNVHVEFKGRMEVLSEIAEEVGVKYGQLYSRLKKGMSVDDAIRDIKEKRKAKNP